MALPNDHHPHNQKTDVNYRQHQRCKSCDHFRPMSTCERVDGNISPDNVCDLWEIRSMNPQGKDREYYESEYNKLQRQ